MQIGITQHRKGYVDRVRHVLAYSSDEEGNQALRRIQENCHKRNCKRQGVPNVFHIARVTNQRN